jgi:hypothetical protein
MPREFQKRFPVEMRNLRMNARKLTTPFDIHETLLEILNFNGDRNDHSPKRGISLFRHIPADRSCEHAGIEAHWCACLSWKSIHTTNKNGQYTPLALNLAKKTVDFMNSLISANNVDDTCNKMMLHTIDKLSKLDVNEEVHSFINSRDIHGREAAFINATANDGIANNTSKRTESVFVTYQIVLTTMPGNAIFEISFRFDRSNERFHFNRNEISRINSYNQTSFCIFEKRPDMRQFCFCKNQVKQ